MSLEHIIANGNRGFARFENNVIRCRDGFGLSVIAGGGTYCSPRPTLSGPGEVEPSDHIISNVPSNYPGPYSAVEVGFPSDQPEPWDCPHGGDCTGDGGAWECYAETRSVPTGTVYAYVPVGMVRALVASHGGEVAS